MTDSSWSKSNNRSLQPRYAAKLMHKQTRNLEAPLISTTNRKKRLQFARVHQNLTVEDWKNVAWSDESW